MMYSIAHEVGKNAGKDDEWGMQTFAKDITLQRLSEPEDVANARFRLHHRTNHYRGRRYAIPLK